MQDLIQISDDPDYASKTLSKRQCKNKNIQYPKKKRKPEYLSKITCKKWISGGWKWSPKKAAHTGTKLKPVLPNNILHKYPITKMCEIARVSKSGYYKQR